MSSASFINKRCKIIHLPEKILILEPFLIHFSPDNP